MLSASDLLSVRIMPTEEEITLHTIASFYEEFICERQICYEVRHKTELIRLRFKRGDLCHLLGIQHIKNGYDSRGEHGFNAIKNGEMTFESLRAANIGGYNEMRFRILYFPFIYQLLQNPNIVIENEHVSTSIVKAQFVFYDTYGARLIELKIRRENADNPQFYVPVSFSVLRKTRPRTHVIVCGIRLLHYNDNYRSHDS